ncbi:velvet factor-domain-containing protein [Russula vinacea]|nr:velvet factor-domain-containing protein [Russula vinacea]
MAVHFRPTDPLPAPAPLIPDPAGACISLNAKRCVDDWWRPLEQSKLGLLGDGSSGVLSLLALFQPHKLYALMFEMAFSVNLCSVMLHVSRAHLRCDPQGCISRDSGEVPTLPRNARVIAALCHIPSSVPARSISDRPSSSRSSESPYYTRPAGTGNWGAPRPPTRLPEPQCASLLPSTAFHPDNPGLVSPQRETKTYYLEVIQQPEVSAEFGTAALSRLPLAPPLVAQLIIRDSRGNVIESDPDHPYLICHLSLYSADGMTVLDPVSSSNRQFPPDRLLYGNLVSSPHFLRNLQGRSGVYFLFPDVSVRLRGRYILQLTLMRLSRVDASGMVRVGESGSVLAQTRTRPFEVRPRHIYVAPPQTPLTEFFLQQGARMYAFASRSSRLRSDDSF